MGSLQGQNENEIWKEYRTQLHRFVLKRVSDESQTEDIVHDVLLKAYAQKDTLKDSGKLRPWLYQITRNAIVDYYRSKSPAGPLPDQLIAEETTGDNAAQLELSRCLAPLIKSLPSHYREPLELVEIKGLKQREMATELDLTLSGAKSRIQRARKLLATALLQCCEVEFDRRGGVLEYNPRKSYNCC